LTSAIATAPEGVGTGLVDRVPVAVEVEVEVEVPVPLPVAVVVPEGAAEVGASPDPDPVPVGVPVAELDGTIYRVPVAVLLGYAGEPDALATAEGLCICVCEPECDWLGRRLCVAVPVAVPVEVIDIEGRGGYADAVIEVRSTVCGEGVAVFEHISIWHDAPPADTAVEFMQYAYAAAHDGVERSMQHETPPPVPGFCEDANSRYASNPINLILYL
jgi:hypothetical protein